MAYIHWAEDGAEVFVGCSCAGSCGVGVGSKSMMDLMSEPDAIERFSDLPWRKLD
jgi:hypothetical protein